MADNDFEDLVPTENTSDSVKSGNDFAALVPSEEPVKTTATEFSDLIPAASDHSAKWNSMQAEGNKTAKLAGIEGSDPRDRLTKAINDIETAGFPTPHFIGSDKEPTGDRAPTIDQENLVKSLKKQEASLPAGEERDVVAKKRAYWENEISQYGMSAEQWKSQTGEADPISLEKLQAADDYLSQTDSILASQKGKGQKLNSRIESTYGKQAAIDAANARLKPNVVERPKTELDREAEKNYGEHIQNLLDAEGPRKQPDFVGPSGDVHTYGERNQMTEFLRQHRDSNMVQRILNPQDFPDIDNGDGTHSSHFMSQGEQDGKFYAYPEIQYDPKTNVAYKPKDPLGTAIKNGDALEFPTAEEALKFSANGYKAAWGAGLGNELAGPEVKNGLAPVTKDFNNYLNTDTFKNSSPDEKANLIQSWAVKYQGTDQWPQAQALFLQKAAQEAGITPELPKVESTMPPPTWEEVKASSDFKSLTAAQQKERLNEWAQGVQEYTSENAGRLPQQYTPDADSLPEFVANEAQDLHFVPKEDKEHPIRNSLLASANEGARSAAGLLGFSGGEVAGTVVNPTPTAPLTGLAAGVYTAGKAAQAYTDTVQYLADNGFNFAQNILTAEANQPNRRIPFTNKEFNAADVARLASNAGLGLLTAKNTAKAFNAVKGKLDAGLAANINGVKPALSNTTRAALVAGTPLVLGGALGGGISVAEQKLEGNKNIDWGQALQSAAAAALTSNPEHALWKSSPYLPRFQAIATKILDKTATPEEKQFFADVATEVDKQNLSDQIAATLNQASGGTTPKTSEAVAENAVAGIQAPDVNHFELIDNLRGPSRTRMVLATPAEQAHLLSPDDLSFWKADRRRKLLSEKFGEQARNDLNILKNNLGEANLYEKQAPTATPEETVSNPTEINSESSSPETTGPVVSKSQTQPEINPNEKQPLQSEVQGGENPVNAQNEKPNQTQPQELQPSGGTTPNAGQGGLGRPESGVQVRPFPEPAATVEHPRIAVESGSNPNGTVENAAPEGKVEEGVSPQSGETNARRVPAQTSFSDLVPPSGGEKAQETLDNSLVHPDSSVELKPGTTLEHTQLLLDLEEKDLQKQIDENPPTKPAADNAAAGATDTGFEAATGEQPKPENPPTEGVVPPERPGEGPTPPNGEPSEEFAITQEAVNKRRVARGEEPLPKEASVSDIELEGRADAMEDKTPGIGRRIVDEVVKTPRSLSAEETILVGRESMRAEKELTEAVAARDAEEIGTPEHDAAEKRVREASEALANTERALSTPGSLQGLSFRARQLILRNDFSVGRLIAKIRANDFKGNHKLSKEEVDKVNQEAIDTHNKLERLSKLEDEKERQRKSDTDEHYFNQLIKGLKGKTKEAKTKGQSLAEHFADISKAADNRINKRNTGQLHAFGAFRAFDPRFLTDVAIREAFGVGSKVIEKAQLLAKLVKEFGEKISPHLEEIWDKANKFYDAQKAAFEQTNGPKEKEPLTRESKNLGRSIYDIRREKFNEGIADREANLKAATEEVKKQIPDITEEEVRDAFSDYGKVKHPSQEADRAALRKWRTLDQLTAQIRDLKAGLPALKSGRARDKADQKISDLTKRRNQLMRDLRIENGNSATEIASANDARKTALKNQIENLQREIDTGEKAPKTEPIEDTQEVKDLRKQRDDLKAKIESKKTVDQKTKEANEARLKSLDRKIKTLEEQIKAGGKPERKTPLPENDEVIAKREQVETLKAELQKLEDIKYPPEDVRLAKDKENIKRNIAKLEERIKNNNYEPAQKPNRKLDNELLDLQHQQARVRDEFNQRRLEAARALESTGSRLRDLFLRLRRFNLLTGITVFGKLGAAGTTRLGSIAAEEAVGGILSPLLKPIADKAAREGYTNPVTGAAALAKGFVQGVKNIPDILKGNRVVTEANVSKPDLHPKETGLRQVLDIPGRAHAAVKSPFKEAERALSTSKLEAHAVRQGEDIVNDKAVRQRITDQAHENAKRAIFLQDNILTDIYKIALNASEKSKKFPVAGKAFATVLRYLLPIVKVPTNIAIEAGVGLGGTVSGSLLLVNALRKGLKNVEPAEADLILRHLKKGSVGMALFLLGYFDSKNVGGFYQEGEHRKKNDVKAGAAKLMGINVPSWFFHSPAGLILQAGATFNRVQNAKEKGGGKKGIGPASGAAVLGILENVPFVREMGEIDNLLRDGYKGTQVRGNLLKSNIPMGVQNIATFTDPLATNRHRAPGTAIQYFESGIPGLREKVPSKVNK